MDSKCPKCHTRNPDSVKFCGECGTQLPPFEDVGKRIAGLNLKETRQE